MGVGELLHASWEIRTDGNDHFLSCETIREYFKFKSKEKITRLITIHLSMVKYQNFLKSWYCRINTESQPLSQIQYP